MSYSISTLLLRNLSDVFGENDSVRRRSAIDEISVEHSLQRSAPLPWRVGRQSAQSNHSRAR
jgi:hypothetical protein